MKLGTTELLVILVIIIVLFGPSQLPKLAKLFGKSVKNVRKGMKEDDEEQKAVTDQANANAGKEAAANTFNAAAASPENAASESVSDVNNNTASDEVK